MGRSTAPLEDHFPDGTSGILRDICPFTTMGLFNRGLTDQNRRSIARGLANVLGVEEPVPESFTGIPTLNNLNAWFFPYAANRDENHIDALWEVLSRAVAYADSGDEASLFSFVESFNTAISLPSVGPRLTTGLYWVRPWTFPTLDGRTTRFINDKVGDSRCQEGDRTALTIWTYGRDWRPASQKRMSQSVHSPPCRRRPTKGLMWDHQKTSLMCLKTR